MNQKVTTLQSLKQTASMPANQAGDKNVAAFFEANKKSMAQVLPRHIDADRMTRIALSALRNTPKLMECTTASLMGGIMQLAQLGLEPNTPLGHAYLIPFRNRKMNRTDVQVMLGYQGLLSLARRSGEIISLSAHAVYENDEFSFAYGLEDNLVHRPVMDNRGDVIAFYAVAKLTGGGHVFEVISNDAMIDVMKATQSGGKYGPWATHYEAMGRKTTIRRLFKYLPVSIEIATASAMDEVAESGGDQHLETALEGNYTIVNDDYNHGDSEKPAQERQPEPRTPEDNHIRDEELQTHQTESDKNNGQVTDSNGEIFNQDIHATGKDGRPAFKHDGSFRARRGSAKQKPKQSQVQEQETPQAPPQAESGASFAVIADMINIAETQNEINKAMSLGGELPDDQQGELRSLAYAKSKTFDESA